jgi:hypothetical protein
MNEHPKWCFFHTITPGGAINAHRCISLSHRKKEEYMPGIFTRPKLLEILQDEAMSNDERLDKIMSLRGRDLDDGYVTKAAAREDRDQAVADAKAEWEKNLPKPNIMESEEYKSLESEYAGYKAMQEAKGSEDYKGVKGKFFETVYGMVKREEGAAPIADQMTAIKEQWPEYFTENAPAEQPKNTPQYSKDPGRAGTNPESEEDKLTKQLLDQWK